MKSFFLKRIKVLTFFILLLSLTGYLGTVHWIFELTAHFKGQYFALSLFFSIILLLTREWKWAGVGMLSLFLNALVVLPWYFSETQTIVPNQALKLLHANVNVNNYDYAAFMQLVQSEQPDIVIVQEIDVTWVRALKILEEGFPYQLITKARGIFGSVILSRFPFETQNALLLGSRHIESLFITLRFSHKTLSLLATHPLPPINSDTFKKRNHQLFAVNALLEHYSIPKILIGDLNISMWSPFYQKLNLHNARQGFGILPTWPTFLPFMMLPIDHCLVSADIQVRNMKTGSAIGSDHLPLIIELAF
ncbi:MAG: endonuclease/exonuclease/phosphatase family protein [Thiomargarita sp.]|nr:endonuclease/exonuclease/phosphatase family protein [Thiomargarita sp.]